MYRRKQERVEAYRWSGALADVRTEGLWNVGPGFQVQSVFPHRAGQSVDGWCLEVATNGNSYVLDPGDWIYRIHSAPQTHTLSLGPISIVGYEERPWDTATDETFQAEYEEER